MTASAPLHPEIWVFEQLLASIGWDATASYALGFSGGPGFIGMGFRYDEEDVSHLHVSGWNPFQSDLPRAAKRLGVIGTLDETSRRRRAAKSLESGLDTGRPLAVWLDTSTVGLTPPALAGASPGVVIAARTQAGGITLSDGSRTVETDPATLAVARSIHGAQRYRVLALAPPKSTDRAAALRSGLATLAVGPTGGEASDSGPDGIRQLAESIDGDGDGTWRVVFEGDRHLLGALTTLHASIVREQGLLRGAQAAFEREAAQVLRLPGLAEAAEAHAALAAEWLAVAERALPADVPGLAAARDSASAADLPAWLVEQPLPLTATELDELLRDLGQAAAALVAPEAEVVELIRETLRPGQEAT